MKIKNKFENKKNFRYFNIRNFEIPKYRRFYIWSLQMLTPAPFFRRTLKLFEEIFQFFAFLLEDPQRFLTTFFT